MKRILAFLLTLALLIGAIPAVPAAAEEETAGLILTQIVPQTDLPDNDTLFAGYVQGLYYGSASAYGTSAGARLMGNEKILYDALVPILKQIAAGERSNTVIGIGPAQEHEGVAYPSDADVTFVTDELDISSLISALLTDLPYELYWYDKTIGTPAAIFGTTTDPVHVQLSFPVAGNYAAGQYAVDTTIAAAAADSAENAQDILDAHDGKSDYEKLTAYKDAICQLVSYDSTAADAGTFSDDNDPWQLIHVFDGDDSTNVVCEGYSKAFMYLCDRSDFSGEITCITVSGEDHMWNILQLDGTSYLVDVTNSDTGTAGADGSLFLAGGTGSVTEGYTVGGLTFAYDSRTIDLWGTDADSILALSAQSYDPNAGSDEGGEGEATPCEHAYGDWVQITAPTCSSTGLEERSCPLCLGTESRELPMLDHIYENGICTGCGGIDPSTCTHSFGQWEQISAPSCTDPGCNQRMCSLCGTYEYENIPTLAHIFENGVCTGCGMDEPTCTADGFAYEIDGDHAIITGYVGSATEITIPSVIEEKPVSTIGGMAFANNWQITAVTVPASVTTISEYAFQSCQQLQTVTLCDGLVSIGEYAFAGCVCLEHLALPATVTAVGEGCFHFCTGLITLSLPASLPAIPSFMTEACDRLWHVYYTGTQAQWDALPVGTYNDPLAYATVHCDAAGSDYTTPGNIDCCGKVLVHCTVCGGNLYDSTYTGALGDHAYTDWAQTLAPTCTATGWEERSCPLCLGSEARELPMLEHTYDEDNVCTVCGYAPIPVPDGLTYTVGTNAVTITGYTGTNPELIIPTEIEGKPVTAIAEAAFRGNLTITFVSLPNTITIIDECAFDCCRNLEDIAIPEGVTFIGKHAFNGCTSLTSIWLPDSLTSLGRGAFSGCSALELAVLGTGIKTIELWTFENCSSLRCFAITSSTTQINGAVFNGCTALECCVYLGTYEQFSNLRAYSNGNEVLGEIYYYLEGTCCPPEVKMSSDSATGKPKLIWGKEACAIGYAIFRSDSADGEYEYLDVTDGTSYVDTSVQPGQRFFYIVVGISPYGNLGLDSNVVSSSSKCAAPILTASNKASTGKPVISWEAVYGAAKYEVYRATSKTGKYTKVKTTTATSYTDTDASAGKTYYYKVKTIASSSKNNSGYSDVVSQLCICAQPATTLTTASATGSPVIKWKEVSGAKKYEIYRSYSQEGEFELIATTESLSYTDKTAPADTDCWYKVNALGSSEARNSIDAAPKLIHSALARPNVTATADTATGKPVLSWEAVECASEYQIYRATKSSGKYTAIATVTDLTYTDTAASRGRTYYYKVRACSATAQSAYSSVDSCACRNAQPVLTLSNKASTGKPVIKWTKVSGASKYVVYRATSQGGKYTKVKTTTSTSYTDTAATVGKTYYYKVRALASSSTYNSAYSAVASRLCICAQPSVTLSVSSTTGKPLVKWSKVSGAGSYEVYRAYAQDGPFELLISTAELSYSDTTVPVDTDCWYKVNAIAADPARNSIDATPKLIHTTLAKPNVTAAADAATGKPVLSWEAVEGAVNYKIYRATKKSGSYKAVATVTDPGYTDTAASRGRTYYYKVRAYGAGAKSSYSSIDSCACRNVRPTVTVSVKTASGKPVVTWNKISGTKNYQVYRATAPDGTYTKVKTTSSRSFTDTSAAVGTTYYYKVRSVASSSKYTGAFSLPQSCLCICGQPALSLSVSSTTGKPSLSWKAISGAQSYEIWRMEADGTQQLLLTQTGTAYHDDSAKADTDYSYKVNALGAAAELNSADGTYKAIHTTLAKPNVTAAADAATGKPVLSWEAVEGAVNYKIYRATKKSGSYKAVATVTDPGYTDTAASRGRTYYYKVRAYGAGAKSSYSSIDSCACRNAQPVLTVTVNTAGNPVLSWNKISGTKNYQLYRATAPDGAYTKVKTTTSLKYTDSAPADGVTYYYKVRSVASSSKYTGVFSQVVTFPTVP